MPAFGGALPSYGDLPRKGVIRYGLLSTGPTFCSSGLLVASFCSDFIAVAAMIWSFHGDDCAVGHGGGQIL